MTVDQSINTQTTTSCMLTTFDNPYNPFEQFNLWFLYDERKGYHTCSYLGRIANTSDQLSDAENNVEIERAIDEIIRYDFMNVYRKIKYSNEIAS